MARILAVDDSAAVRRMVNAALSSAGHEVEQAADGDEALQKAQSGSFDLVITDLTMPRMDGIALVRRLRGLAAYQDVPLLVLTTEAAPERKQAGRAAGATGWLLKPFDPQRLLTTISRVLT